MTNFKTKSNRSILHPGEAPPPQATPVKDRLKAKLAEKKILQEYHLYMNKTYGKNPPY
jgi:hypothetical protein